MIFNLFHLDYTHASMDKRAILTSVIFAYELKILNHSFFILL